MLTRKHFQKVAEIIGASNSTAAIAVAFKDYFAEENKNFNSVRFFDAIKKEKEKEKEKAKRA